MMGIYRSMVALIGLLLLGAPADAAGTASSAVELRQTISRHLDREGYLGRFRNGQDFERAVSAYLWDHRHALKTVEIPSQQKHEVLICLLLTRGYPGFDDQAADVDFARWCKKMTK